MSSSSEALRFCGLSLDKARGCLISMDGEEIALRPQSLAVFELLAANAGSLVSKETLFEEVWLGEPVSDDSLAQCIADIRRALGDGGRSALRTVPRRGYMLTPDKRSGELEPPRGTVATGRRWLLATACAIVLGTALVLALSPTDSDVTLDTAGQPGARLVDGKNQAELELPESGGKGIKPLGADTNVESTGAAAPRITSTTLKASRPLLGLELGSDGGDAMLAERFMAELRAVFARYKTVELAVPGETPVDYRLVASFGAGKKTGRRLLVEASDALNGEIFSSRSFDIPVDNDSLYQLAVRTAAFASPAGGDLARYLMRTAIHKPVSQLTASECYAHAYDCTSCAGQMDHVSERAVECIDALLESNPQNVTALALKGALHAHQYRWGSALPEPERTDLYARRHRATMAVEVAEKAASLSDGKDPVVFWGLVQGYMATCQIDKMRDAAHRGLALNPDDPGLLAVFGNWLSYAGLWKEGRAMVERSLAIEPAFYRRWWLMALAKNHYNADEYEQAYQWFQKSFNERNWVSHLQSAYTLPYLGRLDEAKQAVREAMRWYPGVTVEKALQFYEVGCFSSSFRTKMRDALVQAGLPSRGASADINEVRSVPAKLVKVNGAELEYVDIGKGEPVLFVHGAFADYRAWAPYETRISAKHRFISYTQRWHGTRPWPEPYVKPTVQMFADDLISFIETLNIGPVHIVTWSMSGPITIKVQVQRPDLIKSVVHFEPVIDGIADEAKPFTEVKQRFFAPVPKIRERMAQGDLNGAVMQVWELVAERAPGAFDKMPPLYKRSILDNSRSLIFVPLENKDLDCDYLSAVKSPTLVVHGSSTNEYWQHLSERAASCMPGAELAVIEGETHVAPIFRPDQLSQLVLDHVEKHTGGAK